MTLPLGRTREGITPYTSRRAWLEDETQLTCALSKNKSYVFDIVRPILAVADVTTVLVSGTIRQILTEPGIHCVVVLAVPFRGQHW